MSSQPVLVVIGVAIIVNLVIMVALLAMLIARRRHPVSANGIAAPAPYRYDMAQGRPTAVSTVSYMPDRPGERPMSEMDDEFQQRSDTNDLERDSDTATVDQVEQRIKGFFADEEGSTTTEADTAGPGESAWAMPPAQARVGGPPAAAAAAVALTARPAEVSDTDPLTGLDGPLVWDVRIRDEDARFSRYRRPVAVVLIELDGLDRLATVFGEEAMNRILPTVGHSILRQARATDHVARIRDGRFAALLPETDEVQAINFVERVRSECDLWLASGQVSMRLAIGWSSPVPGSQLSTALRVAEDRLDRDRRRPVAV